MFIINSIVDESNPVQQEIDVLLEGALNNESPSDRWSAIKFLFPKNPSQEKINLTFLDLVERNYLGDVQSLLKPENSLLNNDAKIKAFSFIATKIKISFFEQIVYSLKSILDKASVIALTKQCMDENHWPRVEYLFDMQTAYEKELANLIIEKAISNNNRRIISKLMMSQGQSSVIQHIELLDFDSIVAILNQYSHSLDEINLTKIFDELSKRLGFITRENSEEVRRAIFKSLCEPQKLSVASLADCESILKGVIDYTSDQDALDSIFSHAVNCNFKSIVLKTLDKVSPAVRVSGWDTLIKNKYDISSLVDLLKTSKLTQPELDYLLEFAVDQQDRQLTSTMMSMNPNDEKLQEILEKEIYNDYMKKGDLAQAAWFQKVMGSKIPDEATKKTDTLKANNQETVTEKIEPVDAKKTADTVVQDSSKPEKDKNLKDVNKDKVETKSPFTENSATQLQNKFQAELDHLTKFLAEHSSNPKLKEEIKQMEEKIVAVPALLSTPEQLPDLIATLQAMENNIVKKLSDLERVAKEDKQPVKGGVSVINPVVPKESVKTEGEDSDKNLEVPKKPVKTKGEASGKNPEAPNEPVKTEGEVSSKNPKVINEPVKTKDKVLESTHQGVQNTKITPDSGIAVDDKVKKVFLKMSPEQCKNNIKKLLEATKEYQQNLSSEKEENKKIHILLNDLSKHLQDNPPTLKTIQEFYALLKTPNAKDSPTNFEMIQSNTERSSTQFALGVTLIALTIITGIIPGLIAMAVMHHKGYNPMKFFKTHSENYEESIGRVKKEVKEVEDQEKEVENRPQGRR